MSSGQTRVCTKCRQEKPINQFGWRNKVLGIRHNRCLACVAEASTNWYAKNRQKQIANSAKRRLAARDEARKYVWNYLHTHPCVDCGESDPVVLEFDHVRGRKSEDVSVMVQGGWSLNAIQTEIAKCDVRCANCHRQKSILQFGWYNKQKSN